MTFAPMRATAYEVVKPPREAATEANHRVANSLAIVAALIQIQARDIATQTGSMERAQVCRLLEEISHRIDAVGRLHRLLAHLESGARIDLLSYLREISQAIVTSMSDGLIELIEADEGDCFAAAERALPLGLIVSELVTNAVKYAHPSGVPGTVTIGCRRDGGRLCLRVADDGVGLPDGFDPAHASSLGMRLARSLAGQLGATLSFMDTGTGLMVEIALPA